MWMRAVMTVFVAGCIGAGDAAAPSLATATVAERLTRDFECLNHTSVHVVTCDGSISLFPITVTIGDVRILSDNEISILSGDLNDLTLVDGDVLDHDTVLGDVEAVVVDDFLDKFSITVTGGDVLVCTTVTGAALCL